MSSVVLVGNPKARSRTFEAAQLVVERLTGHAADLTVDLIDFGSKLFDWSDDEVTLAVESIARSDLLVVASPTYKGTFTGLLKLFLDRVGGGAWSGVTAVPVMLGGDLRHALAPEVFLKPLLAELGASCPTAGLFLIDAEYATSPALDSWLEVARPRVERALVLARE